MPKRQTRTQESTLSENPSEKKNFLLHNCTKLQLQSDCTQTAVGRLNGMSAASVCLKGIISSVSRSKRLFRPAVKCHSQSSRKVTSKGINSRPVTPTIHPPVLDGKWII